MGPFEIWLSPNNSEEEQVVVVNGLQNDGFTPHVEAFRSTNFRMSLIATKLGVQKITGITVFDISEKRTYDPLPDLEKFVDSH